MAKVCPLLLIASAGDECLEEKCAWYVEHEDPNVKECAIKELSDDLKYISLRIAELSSK